MDSSIHILIATTLSMIMTFMLYYTLKDTRANDSLFQNILVDRIRDRLLYTRCLLDIEKINGTCGFFFINEDKYNIPILIPIIGLQMSQMIFFGLQNRSIYVRPIIATLLCGWFIARLFDSTSFCYNMDTISVYFLIWQVMLVTTKWELKQLPTFSPTFNRGWVCVLMAFGAFTAYDVIFRYLSTQLSFIFFWMISFADIFLCLHPKGRLYNRNSAEEVLKTDLHIPLGFYSTWDLDDSELDEDREEQSLGHGDFYIYNVMLLIVLPPLSSVIIKVLVTIGYIIIVQIGCWTTFRLGLLYNQDSLPGVPLPVAVVSMYAVILDVFIEY